MTYKTTSVGLMEGPIRTQQNIIGLPIRASVWGQHIIDYISQGGGHFIVFTVKEWMTGAKQCMWPFNASHGVYPITGELLNAYAGAVVMTALTGTPANTVGPATRTYNLALLLPGHNIDVTFGPMERNVPIVMCVLPEQSATAVGKAVYLNDT
jgi:hypothetical protein